MRSLFLVAYDVRDAKRLRRTYLTMRGFGEALQYSVFLCRLSPKERVLLKGALLDVVNQKEDRVMIVDLGPVEGMSEGRLEFVGQRIEVSEPSAYIV